MTLHEHLHHLMLAVDRVGSRLGAAVSGSTGEVYEMVDYSPDRELVRLYALHKANTGF